MVVLGEEDQVVDTPESPRRSGATCPGVETEILPGVGHTPQVEAPDRSARLIEGFAADAAPTVKKARNRR